MTDNLLLESGEDADLKFMLVDWLVKMWYLHVLYVMRTKTVVSLTFVHSYQMGNVDDLLPKQVVYQLQETKVPGL